MFFLLQTLDEALVDDHSNLCAIQLVNSWCDGHLYNRLTPIVNPGGQD